MSLLNSESELAAAVYHETGHAVVAHFVGETFNGITMNYSKSMDRWCGKTERLTRNRQDRLCDAQIAVAGMLAEAKARAMRLHGGSLGFLRNDKMESLLSFLTSEHSEASPGMVSIGFQRAESGEPLFLEFSGELYSGTDRGALQKALGDSLKPIPVIVDTMFLLDEPRTWNSIVSIAEALTRARPESTAIEWRMEGDDIRALIQRG